MVVQGGVGIGGNLYTGGNVIVKNTTASTDISYGALVVQGGVGIGGNLYTGGNVIVKNTTASTDISYGALVVQGGVGIGGNIFTAGNVIVKNTTASTDVYSGAMIVQGGIGIFGNVNVGGDMHTNGNCTLQGGTDSIDMNTGTLVVNGGIGVSGNINANVVYATSSQVNNMSVYGTVNASYGVLNTINVNSYINSGLIQYYPFDNNFNNYATGFSILDLSYSDTPPTLYNSSVGNNAQVVLIPTIAKYSNIVDNIALQSYMTFENTLGTMQPPQFDSTAVALFFTNVQYLYNSTQFIIPTSFSICFWITLLGYYAVSNVSIINISTIAGQNPQISLDIDADGFLYNNLGQKLTYQMLSSGWQHVAWIYNQGISKIFINGSIADISNAAFQYGSTSLTCPIGTFMIGNNQGQEYMSGYQFEMQHYRLYNRAISDSDVLNLYNNTGIYYKQVMIPSQSVGVVAGDFGVVGNTIVGGSLGVGINNPQCAVDICGNINVRGSLSTTTSPVLTYTSLPTLTPNQVGYIANGIMTNSNVVNKTVNNLSRISVPMGVWMFNAQGVFQATSSGDLGIKTAILSLYDSSLVVQPNNLAVKRTPIFAFSEMYYPTKVIDVNVDNSLCYYSTNITQVLPLSEITNTIYLNSLFDVSGTSPTVVCDISSSYFTATRLA